MEHTDQGIISGYVREISKDVDETRTITFVASTSSIDRHKTVLNQANWELKHFNNNPVIGYQHDLYGGDMCNKADPDDVIGSGRAYLEDIAIKDSKETEKALMVDIKFEASDVNEKADKIFKKIKAGTLNSVSVGFLPKGKGRYGQQVKEGGDEKTINEDVWYFDAQELLEISIVNIPANPEANRRSMHGQTIKSLHVLKRLLNKSYGEIEEMKVGDVIAQIEGKEIQPAETKKEEVKEEVKGPETKEEATTEEPIVEKEKEISENNLLIKQKKLFLLQHS